MSAPHHLYQRQVVASFSVAFDVFLADHWHQRETQAMKTSTALVALLFSALAVAQGLPRFGFARFGEAAFGVVQATPVPFMPLWATITLAASFWVVVYLMRVKES